MQELSKMAEKVRDAWQSRTRSHQSNQKKTTLSTRVAFPALEYMQALYLSNCGTQIWLKAALKLSQHFASTRECQTLL